MEGFLNKISEYNLFNYLLPGFVFIFVVEKFYSFDFLHEVVLINLFVAYFLGMVLSRIGSIFIEKSFIAINFVRYAAYSDYLSAEKEDSKLKILVQENNTYRTFVAVFFILSSIALIQFIGGACQESLEIFEYCNLVLLVMFSAAYRKQTSYIRTRVERFVSN